ncbi:LIM and calponin homology domains-containing protein 1 isoform X2 [Kryptolebias marmoratus]|uniref:LIM and calponin homology domains-containing protein 1 isoform X2 n=1 Tax=Kryptolebias marmoratus TaxID=37003 RepID=UPI0007F8A2BF|nr:LIM and calponin homology domains-containing protein 1 isoform X2 [Kryptolebias marmoratus]
MASPVADIGQSHQHHPVTESAADSAFQEAQKWIEAVTGRCFGDKDFRGGLQNGILLCELLSSIRPGSVKKINRLQTPIAGLDNLSVFLRGCEDLGLKGSQLFDPGDLQDTSTRPTAKGSDCSRKLKNVLITIYWLGRAANSCTSYSGPTLDLKEFEGLLSQMRKEAEVADSPTRSIRDSGYIDCWDSERSDSLSPPRHGREDSFDSLDSFGSRSRQTPSPDVLVARGSSDGRGSDSESDGPLHRKVPDLHKDDMLARRTSVTELRTAMPFNQYLPNKSNQSGYVPTPLRKKRNDKEEGGGCKSWSTATSPVGGDRPCSTPARSCSEELLQYSAALLPNTINTAGRHSSATNQKDTGVAGADGNDKRACQMLTSPKSTQSPSGFLPVPSTMATSDASQHRKALNDGDDLEEEKLCLDSSLPATSMSMSDMRGEEEAILQPHSHVRHELIHNQYNRMKEEENHWQEDLARWKSRRRSISQDLIKKEEERKLMERLISGDTCPSQRRRSIKTYREIVEDKERREEELRQAYRKARTPEEASAILQHYAQRFSISEAVLERLQLPKLLDRSISADPSFPLSLSSSPTTPDPFDVDPNGPFKYLRQQSAPTPKFTSTLEAQIEEFPKDLSLHHRPQIRSHSSEPPSTRALSPKPVPLLTPKPYIHPRLPAAETWNSKADGLLRVNGNIETDDVSIKPESEERESPRHFQASPSKVTNSTEDDPSSEAAAALNPHTCSERGSPGLVKAKDTRGSTEAASELVTPPSRPTSLPVELQKTEESFGKTGIQTDAAGEEVKSDTSAQLSPPAAKQEEESAENVSSLVPSEANTLKNEPLTCTVGVSSSQESETALNSAATGSFGYQPSNERSADFDISVRSPQTSSNPKSRWEFFAPPEHAEKSQCGNVSVPVLPQARRGNRWSWDPDEERKRQERWQQEQERMLQEKYQREQEKLKMEWEKAQREVVEEEKKYHEEERRILEETVMPLTPRSSALPSPSRGELSSNSEPQDAIVRSLADWERKQELLERQSRRSADGAEWKQRENDRTSDISTADDSMKTGRSLLSQNSSQTEKLGHGVYNGQKLPPTLSKSTTTPVKSQQESTADGSRQSRPAGERRSVSGKKLCSSCGQPLGKGAAMIIETLSLYFHIQCFKCGVCKGQLGDTTTGTDVRIRNGLLNCNQCYIRSRSAGQPTTL